MSPSVHVVTKASFPLCTVLAALSTASLSPSSPSISPPTAPANILSSSWNGISQSFLACTSDSLSRPPLVLTTRVRLRSRTALSHLSTMHFMTCRSSHGESRKGANTGTYPAMAYPLSMVGRLLKLATSTTPAKSTPSLANSSAVADATAVPRLWPSRTMRLAGMSATSMAQLMAVAASRISPFSVGEPVLRPKPR